MDPAETFMFHFNIEFNFVYGIMCIICTSSNFTCVFLGRRGSVHMYWTLPHTLHPYWGPGCLPMRMYIHFSDVLQFSLGVKTIYLFSKNCLDIFPSAKNSEWNPWNQINLTFCYVPVLKYEAPKMVILIKTLFWGFEKIILLIISIHNLHKNRPATRIAVLRVKKYVSVCLFMYVLWRHVQNRLSYQNVTRDSHFWLLIYFGS